MRVLPLRSSEAIGHFLSSLVTFLNVALTGFVLAAVAARFVFPSLSLEGRTLWLLRSSPLPASTLLWSKFWSGLVPLLVLALALTLLTTAGLGVGPRVTLLSALTIAGLTASFVAQALAWGIYYPKFESENAAQIPTSLGGLLFMLSALLTLGIVVASQFWALRGWVRSGLPWRHARPPAPPELGLAAGFAALVCGVTGVVAYRKARVRLERLEV
jgi:ABC-2 type transport system permease protein